MTEITVKNIEAAAETLKGHVLETPTILAANLSAQWGFSLYLKLENFQYTGAFKSRGARVKLESLTDAERKKGVIAASAGNHAQGVAFHAAQMGIAATIIMPETAPFTKIEKTRNLGAKVELIGQTFGDLEIAAEDIARKKGLTLVHPYDDPHIIAGQGTLALEILSIVPDLEELVIPVGGGGMIAGMAIAAKAINPRIRITGVQAEAFPAMRQAMLGETVACGSSTLAEGIAVRRPGTLPQKIIKELVDDIVLVSELQLEEAIHCLVTRQKIVAEGAGAAGVAAAFSYPERFAGKKVATVICGGNIDDRLLASILLRGLIRDGCMVRLRIELPDQPGSLAAVSKIVGDAGANVIEVVHSRLSHDVPIKHVHIDLVVETRGFEHSQSLIDALSDQGFQTQRISDIR